MYIQKLRGLAKNSTLTQISRKHRKIQKKTWDLIREAIGSESSKSKIDKLTVSDRTVDDPEQIPNEFNKIYCYSWLNHS